MRPEIPLKILGLVSPILAWVEGAQSQALPRSWSRETTDDAENQLWSLHEPPGSASTQEQGWLLGELPTFSLDNVDEVVGLARSGAEMSRSFHRWRPSRAQVTPPGDFDLWHIFETLAKRYLSWNGGKVAIRTGRMIELHELGLRMPLGLIVRHVHARAVAAGEQHLRDVAELPESVSLLPSNSHGLRSVVRRGLSEGHLHLNSVHATEVAWADHMFHASHRRPRGFEIVEWRLLRLARAAARLLAAATTFARVGSRLDASGQDEALHRDVTGAHRGRVPLDTGWLPCRHPTVPPISWSRLVQILDAMYFATSEVEMAHHEQRFNKGFRDLVDGSLSRADFGKADRFVNLPRKSRSLSNRGRLGLLHWLDPHRLSHLWHDQNVERDYIDLRLRSPVEREESLALLHLAAHLALVDVPRERWLDSGSEAQSSHSTVPRWRYPTAEGQFLHHALFRYLVCQTHYWQLGVQQGRTTGLRHFKRYFDSRQRWPIESTDHARADAVFRRVRTWRGLRVLEGRVAPPKHSRDLEPWLGAFADAPRPPDRVERFGMVVHFIKRPERHPMSPLGLRARFADQRSEYRRQALDLYRILAQPRLATPFIVGIDAANLELATPPEVFASAFRFLRDRPIALGQANALDYNAWSAHDAIRHIVDRRRLGMTYHVGEEFRHLLSGLRAIDEVLEFLAPQSGDRLGHAIALGLAPQTWLDHIGRQAIVPKQEWLDTLVWTSHFLGAGHDALGRLDVHEEIERLGRALYRCNQTASERSITPLMLRDVWLLRQLDPEMLELGDGQITFHALAGDDDATWRWNIVQRAMVESVLDQVGPSPPVDLLSDYWFSAQTRSRGAELMLVDMEEQFDDWLQVFSDVQRELQQRVAKRQITIEVNPSANRVIGPIGRYADHHIFNLTFDSDNWKRHLRVTVNTDNPATANTCLTHEFYLLGEALTQSGVPEAEVADWLDWLRRSGNDSSFVGQLPEPRNCDMLRLIKRLKRIRRPLSTIRDPDLLIQELWKRL